MVSKINYLVNSGKNVLLHKGFECPSCGNSESALVMRKYIVTQLRRCQVCDLQFRVPTTSYEENANFYQSEYSQGFTTDMPSPEELEKLKSSQFQGSQKDASHYISLLSALGCTPGQTFFDYGCSWGYGSWQFMKAGYNVTSFEISVPRCSYAREHLQVNAHHDMTNIQGPFDIFFSAHVLEHVPSVKDSIELAVKLLKPGGLFVAFTPNGSEEHRAFSDGWNKLWGEVHPNFLDRVFYEKAFASQGLLLASSPYQDQKAIREWAATAGSSQCLDLTGGELMAAVRLG